MSNFSLAVAFPLDNYKFSQPTFVSATLTAAITSVGSIVIYLTHLYPAITEVKLTTVFKRGDTITLTSSNSSYNGYTEQAEIEKIEYSGGYKVTLKEPLAYLYDAGDSVKGYGTGMPDGWIQGSGNVDNLSQTTIQPPGGGYSDGYGFYSLCNVAGTSWIAHRDFELDYWKEYCWYRQGCMVKGYLTGGASTFRLGAFDKVTGGQYTNDFKPTADNTWEHINYNFLSAANLSEYLNNQSVRSRYGNVAFYMIVDSTLYSYAWSTIDDMYLEHIRGIAPITQSLMNIAVQTPSYPVSVMVHNPTDFTVGSSVSVWGQSNSVVGDVVYAQGKIDAISGTRLTISGLPAGYSWASGAMIEQANTGVYEFTEYPDQNVTWEPISSLTTNRTSNNGLQVANTSGWGERSDKIQVKMQFSIVDFNFYKKMKKFEDYCKRGELLNLHGLSTELPETGKEFVQGIMQLSGFSHDYWDRQRCSFSMNFIEV